MKKGIALILGLTIWVSGTSTVMAEENISEVNSVYTCQNTYESRLPLEVTYDITLGEIEEDILNYIAFNKLDVVYGSDQYLELLNEFTFYPADNLDDYMIKYYSAYASVYRSTEDIKLELDKTINDIRNENIQEEIQMKKELLQIVGVEPAKVTYNVAGAQKYAKEIMQWLIITSIQSMVLIVQIMLPRLYMKVVVCLRHLNGIYGQALERWHGSLG